MPTKNKYYLFLIFTTFIWGTNFHVSQIALSYTSSMLTGTYRYTLGALFLIAIILFKKPSKEQIQKSISKWKEIVFLGIVGAFLYNILFLEGLKFTSAFNGVLIIGLTPLNTALISIPMLKTKLKPKQIIGICFGFTGILMVITKGDIATIQNLTFSKGDLYILAANISFSFGNVFIKKYLTGISPLWLTTLVTVVACICFISVSLFTEQFIFPTTKEYLLAIFFMGALSTAICGAFWFISIKEIGAETSALFMNLVPVFGTSASFLLGDEIVPAQVIGGLLVVVGLLFNSFKLKYPFNR
ncbi:DMT family transporter [Flammeovirga kamogawensis]|uniref:DMT family transporter n=1 Tax=Flammeovirga kamogawensis TaxID=373891 RepID=A0ABX8GWT9_9BACT|nr:DMT family transporter [Flammeovirga kamogawensis]MBB6461226.1 drug/metabolite transporter (DMT)-like permease [Flammeovirga kamogawensis]QWG07787.1 DMT family transporter [Flammeovirga kamogawensis]TRX69593.1 DMT family transporter [Flammeovirga kamogawensis]